jgi:hypothetical protein
MTLRLRRRKIIHQIIIAMTAHISPILNIYNNKIFMNTFTTNATPNTLTLSFTLPNPAKIPKFIV